MPNINLRLTDEQHRELEAWAHDGHRSLQKEIIWRLFSSERDVEARRFQPTGAEDHFKPDPKK